MKKFAIALLIVAASTFALAETPAPAAPTVPVVLIETQNTIHKVVNKLYEDDAAVRAGKAAEEDAQKQNQILNNIVVSQCKSTDGKTYQFRKNDAGDYFCAEVASPPAAPVKK